MITPFPFFSLLIECSTLEIYLIVCVCVLMDFIFQSSFRFVGKLNRKYTNFPYNLHSHTCMVSPTINIPHLSGTFVTSDEPIPIHHYHPMSIVHICSFTLGYGQIYNDMYPPLYYHIGYFTALKSSVLLFIPTSHISWQSLILLSPQFCFFWNGIWLESYIIAFQIGFYHSVICI